MKRLTLAGAVIAFSVLCINCTRETAEHPLSRPPEKAEVFLPGIISTAFYDRDVTFTPDCREVYWSITTRPKAIIMVSYFKKGKWTKPQIAPFSGHYSDGESFITRDGKQFYFASNRPLSGKGAPKDWDIWYMNRTKSGWSEPINAGPVVNSEEDEYYPTLTKDNRLYITTKREDSRGGEDIYVCRFVKGTFQTPVNLGDSINTRAAEYNAMIAPDDSYLIFTTHGRGRGIGGGDMFISFHKEDGTWTMPKNLGEPANSGYFDFNPSLSPDGKIFFLTSNRPVIDPIRPMNSTELYQYLDAPGNSQGDVYWMSSDFIEKLRK